MCVCASARCGPSSRVTHESGSCAPARAGNYSRTLNNSSTKALEVARNKRQGEYNKKKKKESWSDLLLALFFSLNLSLFLLLSLFLSSGTRSLLPSLLPSPAKFFSSSFLCKKKKKKNCPADDGDKSASGGDRSEVCMITEETGQREEGWRRE